jgi:outer membrane protein insertion porin family
VLASAVALFVHCALAQAQTQAADQGPTRAQGPAQPQGPAGALPGPVPPQGPPTPPATPAGEPPAPPAEPPVSPPSPQAAESQLPAPQAPTAVGPAAPPSDSDFTVGDIRVEGLQRVSEGTVYNYLPVNIGDHLTPQRVREAIRALYATGFFRDVQLRREGNTLVVVVLERPSIESFEITGNKDIKTEDLQKSLRNVGLATGKTFDRSVLDELTGYLTDQYFSHGKYGVRIDTHVEEESGNRVKIKVDIKEGSKAKIRQINIVGNTRFKEKEILETLELKTPNWLSWYKQDDRYARETLQGDLEKIRNYYMDRGYANFQIDSTQVAIAPEKEDIFITVNIDEGDVFTLSKDIKLAGTFVVPEAELRRYLLVFPGQTFDRKLITTTQELIQNRLGADGYAFAKVDPVPTPDNANHTVSLTFFIDPGNRVYVRNITFSGSNRINDIVLRREMRQLEGAWLSNTSLERSKQRIQRLPYVKEASFETTPVPGSPDLVDVNFKIEEGPAAQLSGGIGYSEAYGAMLNGQYADANWMGTGQRVAIDLNTGVYSKVYNISHTNPYTSIDNLSRTESLTFSDVTQFVSSSSDFSSKQYSFGLTYAYPITEFQYLRFGGNLSASQLLTSSLGSAAQAVQWVRENGHPSDRIAHDDSTNADYLFYGTSFKAAEALIGWDYDTRNRTLFADRGMRTSVSASATVPGSDVQYWVGNISFASYLPIRGPWELYFYDAVDYGAPFGKTTALPPYRNFFGGGPDSVRGYRESRLGPKDQFGNPYGGNLRITSQTELIFPIPQKWRQSARVSAFYDMGNVFSTDHVTFYGIDGATPVNYKFSYGNLKRSVGIAVQWLAPLGLFKFSYAIPLNARKQTGVNFEDETEGFQFSIGQAF